MAGATSTRSAQRRELDVAHRRLARRIPERVADLTTRDRLERQRRDELPRARGHHHLDLRTELAQATHQVGTLVGRDPAGDTEDDLLAGQALHRGIIQP